MRRVLGFLAALLLLVFVAWWALHEDVAPEGTGPDDAAAGATAQPGDAEATRSARKRERARGGPESAAEDDASAFLRQWPEVGQDRDQDPSLGALSGRVLVAPGQPPAESVVEATLRGDVLARVRLSGKSDFLLKNVAPGSGIALTARAEGYAPGGLDKLIVGAGKVTNVGTVYVGMAVDPDVDNAIEVEVFSAGQPIAGAQVTASSVYYGSLLSLGSYEKQPGGTVVRAQTGDDGVARFAKLPPAQYDFFAEMEGFSFEVRPRQVVQKATRTKIRLDLAPGQTIEGRVQTADGQPVAGARVVILRWGSFTNVPAVSTDAEGKFVAKGLSGGNYLLVFAKEDLGAKEVQNVPAGKKDLVVTIDEGAVLWLRCTDAATGAPVKQFGVRPFRKAPFAYLFAPILEARTEDGVFQTRLLPASDYGAEISADGYALASVAALPLSPKEPTEVKLEPAGVVRGRVVGKTSGKPVRGAQVFVKKGGFPPSRVKDQQSVTDAAGLFTLDRLPLRALSFTISHVDHDEVTFDGVEPVARGSDGALPAPRDFPLGEGGRIEGRVVASTMQPEAGATVQLLVGFDFLNSRSTTTDAQGRYAFVNVPVSNRYAVIVGQVGPGRSGRNRTDVQVTEGGTTVVDFVPEGGGQRVTGRATRDQKPADNVQISLVADDGGQFTGNERTRSDGTFVFENVPAGKYVVRAQGAKVETVVVKAEEAPAEIVLTISSAYIAGKVVDGSTGQPLSGAWMDCELIADASGAGLPDLVRRNRGNGPATAEGTFSFRGLEDGTYQVRAFREGYGSEVSEPVVIVNGASKDGLTFALGPACTVSGVVRNAQGVPVEGAAMQLRDLKGRRVFAISLTQTSGDGTYSQGSLRPDTFDVTFEKEGYAPETQRVTLTAGAPAKLDFVLRQGGRIEVTVRGADGAPVKDAVVTLFDADGRQVTRSLTLANIFSTNRSRTDANGQVVLTGVVPGTYRVAVQVAGREGAVDRAGVEAVEGALTPVEIVIPSGS
jgi:protocatechuate 3,4-dioxygenase beta subunit